MNLITRADFVGLVPLRATLTADQLAAPITDAHTLRLPALGLPAALLADVAARLPYTPPAAYDAAASYSAGQRVTFGAWAWTAQQDGLLPAPPAGAVAAGGVTDADAVPTATEAWTPDVVAGLLTRLRPWLVAEAWQFWLRSAGINADAAGLVVPTDPQGTFQPVSSADRGRLLAENEERISIYHHHLTRYLAAARAPLGLTAAGAGCGGARTARRGRIWGV